MDGIPLTVLPPHFQKTNTALPELTNADLYHYDGLPSSAKNIGKGSFLDIPSASTVIGKSSSAFICKQEPSDHEQSEFLLSQFNPVHDGAQDHAFTPTVEHHKLVPHMPIAVTAVVMGNMVLAATA